ncbi:CPBP family intramembrane metalloprotease [Nocardioides cavernae]|uniref:CPBP family intramembrane metalloprotease n=1 Tax=Nocardioides cavernae TaxID=1921566 RepID=A0ABR8NFW0_9ACTN|nr:CPBP family intramembrane glutamic endopeptidase [Nocardioides cavernae]MBD3926136.1 CPBP family intramembrane metalloprotease [Nocardioides cavernae]MBM7513727.1 membrane protease YdiL (CAAX protease family) [Nocardioides cavernae]
MRRDTGWRLVAGVEVVAVAIAVLTDRFIPAVVIVAMAAISLVVRRRGPGSLGLRRVARPWRMVGGMAAFAGFWTLVNVALLIPVTNHLSGTRQDVSAFSDLEGDVRLLVLYLAASWVLAAFCEEVAFRGYLLTRLSDVLGPGRLQRLVGVLGSSVLFGLLHTEQGVVGVVAAMVAGVVFCALRFRCRTLWAPILAHGFDDTIGFTWFFLFGPFYGLW